MKGFPGFGFNDERFSDKVLHLVHCGKTEKININSLTLSQHSDFFKKLFTSGTEEANGRELQVQANSDSEATATIEVLKFMYLGELNGTLNQQELLDVLLVGDKFLSECCIEACLEKLLTLPMSVDFAIQCVARLPSTDAVSPLKAEAENFFLQNFKVTNSSDVRGLPVGVFDLLVKKKAIDVNKVHNVAMSWADESFTNESEKVQALHEVLPHINYWDMPARDLMHIFETSSRQEYGYMCVPSLAHGFVVKFRKIMNLQMQKYFSWKMKNFSTLTGSIKSDVFQAAGAEWELSAWKDSPPGGYLSLFLKAVTDTTLGHTWNVELSIPKATEKYARAYQHKVVDESTRLSGIDQFISLEKIRHGGYLNDGTLTVNLSLSMVRMAKEF